MLSHNFLIVSTKIILQILVEIIYFPVWWYSVGFVRCTRVLILFFLSREEALGFRVWVINIFVPMYGQQDFAGRIISFIMRLVQIIFRGLFLVLWASFLFLILSLWLSFPLMLIMAILFQLS